MLGRAGSFFSMEQQAVGNSREVRIAEQKAVRMPTRMVSPISSLRDVV
jgi:hypothetical protein